MTEWCSDSVAITAPCPNDARCSPPEETEGHMAITSEPGTAQLCSYCKVAIAFPSPKRLCCDHLRCRYPVSKVASWGRLRKPEGHMEVTDTAAASSENDVQR